MKRKLLLVFTLVASIAQASALTITHNQVRVDARIGESGPVSVFFTGTAIPTSHTQEATLGAYYSQVDIAYSGSGDQVTFANTLDQKRDGSYHSFSDYEGVMRFTVDTTTTYDLSGVFSAIDVASAGQVFFGASLRDLTSGGTLVYASQWSETTPDEFFTLGGGGGD